MTQLSEARIAEIRARCKKSEHDPNFDHLYCLPLSDVWVLFETLDATAPRECGDAAVREFVERLRKYIDENNLVAYGDIGSAIVFIQFLAAERDEAQKDADVAIDAWQAAVARAAAAETALRDDGQPQRQKRLRDATDKVIELTRENARLKAALKPTLNPHGRKRIADWLEAIEAMGGPRDDRELAIALNFLLTWHDTARAALQPPAPRSQESTP